ncbi:SirA family protein [Methylophaga lonarensis MPL]|uniref:SirA family protein n=1 Tax=Methylophaga lonarensis MPL TaxID=1286106 RepID=M7P0M6_9GAMM|nr:sulfurtransferase TusA family protein [Methylophaga lonarensis]EMR13031.1 SirA family protein [Methylophaga lonarensis MPL]
MSDYQLDCQRLLCPLPVIRTQNKVKELAVGDTLCVVCTDPGTKNDIPAWARIHGHSLVSIEDKEDLIYIVVRVGA